ncbi:DUF6119 family protein [Maridesulfovibrio sp.]|uniref:DUF6119 family protein n=1 Tax=Maridesulfovibrio sp. TaxID=2795000 RepID=UPI0029CA255A|nr:DUF6119 family protein [Maridesulfovibrio sp.]
MSNSLSKLSLYRLKDFHEDLGDIKFDSYESVLSTPQELANEISYGFFIYKSPNCTPKWYNFFKNNIDFEAGSIIPKVQTSGFILIINFNDSTYALTGGHGYHGLTKKFIIETRFGIEIAKKILSQEELKGLAQKDASGTVNSLDRVFRSQYTPGGDIENLHRVLTTIRARKDKSTRDYHDIGSSIKAGDSLVVTGKKDFAEIMTFIEKVDSIWNSTSEETLIIPELEPINPKYEKEFINELWSHLLNFVCDNISAAKRSLFLDNADVGFLPDAVEYYKITYKGKSQIVSNYEEVIVILKEHIKNSSKEENPLDVFKKTNLRLKFLDSETLYPPKRLSYYLCGDLNVGSECYFLNAERWYRANSEFLTRIDQEINEVTCINPNTLNLNEWTHPDEDRYNKSHTEHIILDKRLIRVPEEKGGIEFCDLLKITENDAHLIHVKKASGAELRALFAQGLVATELFNNSSIFRDKVLKGEVGKVLDLSHEEELRYYELKDKSAKTPEEEKELKQLRNSPKKELTCTEKEQLCYLENMPRKNINVVYAILDESHRVKSNAQKTIDWFDGNLSLFAKIDLLSRVQRLRGLGYSVALTRIPPFPTRS